VKDNQNYTLEAEEEALKELALRTLREWLCSENYRQDADPELVQRETTLGRELLKRRDESAAPWRDKEAVRLGRLWNDLVQCWCENHWARYEWPRRGRPRRVEYSESTLRKARNIYHGPQGFRPSSTWKWAQSVLGDRTNHRKTHLVVTHEGVHEELYSKLDPKDLEGLNREEVAQLLDLPKKFANHFVRYLVEHKEWEVAKTKYGEGTKRALRRKVP
jgi:hypothetical protein